MARAPTETPGDIRLIRALTCEWPVPDDVFMALESRPEALRDVSGLATWEPELSVVG